MKTILRLTSATLSNQRSVTLIKTLNIYIPIAIGITFTICWLSGVEAKAQNIGMNGTGANPHPSALVDIDATGGPATGLLIPRIPLTAINAAAPVTSPALSLLVYNTASASTGTNAVSPGYYYWDGAKWVRFAYNAAGSFGDSWTTLGNAGTNPTTNFLGTTDNQDVVFRTNNTEKMRVMSSGNIGVGTNVSQTSFHILSKQPATTVHPYRNGLLVQAEGTDVGGRIQAQTSSNIEPPIFTGMRSRGTISSPLAVQLNDGILNLSGNAYNGSNYTSTAAGIHFSAAENWNTTSNGTYISFLTTPTGTIGTTEKMRIEANGNVGIGTIAPIYPLHVVLPDNGSLNGIRFEGLRSVANGHAIRIELTALNSPALSNKKNFYLTNSTPSDASQNRLVFHSVSDNLLTVSKYLLSMEHDGNIGLGLIEPVAALDVANNNSQIWIRKGLGGGFPASAGEGLKLECGINGGVIQAYDYTAGTPKNLLLQSTSPTIGNVGIGTILPQAKLEVTGYGDANYHNGLRITTPNAIQSLDVLPGYALTNSTPAGVQEDLTMTLRSSGTSAGNMAFATGNEEKMRLLANGYFGIGTSSPSQKLHINEGHALIDNTTLTETVLFLNNNNTGTSSSSYISFRNQAGNYWNNYMGGPNGYSGVLPNAMEWWEYPASQSLNPGTCCLARFRISPNNTGVGFATVVIDGTGQMFGNGWAQPSDRTLKTNIKSLTNALDKISKLGGYSYNFTKESGLDDGKVHIGVIAQEVETVLPEAVSQYPQASYKAINYDALIPLQIEAFKELIQENKQQQNQIDALLKRIEQLEKKD